MAITNVNHGVPKLTEGQAKALALKLESFWSELSPAERAHFNLALSRLADDASDVSAHASLAEYGFLFALIAAFL